MVAVVIVAVGSITVVPSSGIAALDVRVSWLLPATRLLSDGAAAVTVGCLVVAAVLLPGTGTVGPVGYRWLHRATWPAVLWAVALGSAIPGQLVEFLNTDLANVSAAAVVSFVTEIPAGQSQVAAALLVGVVAVGSRRVLTMLGARLLLILALTAVVPPALAEYTEAEGTAVRVAATAGGMVVHALAALLWSGALVALLLGRLPAGDLVGAVQRYSRLAPALVGALAVGGLVAAAGEFDGPGQVLGTAYGRLVVLKVVALAGLVALGWWHRRHTLPALAAGRIGAFRRIAGVEVVLFAATLGLAVGLSRAPGPELAASTAAVGFTVSSETAGPGGAGAPLRQ